MYETLESDVKDPKSGLYVTFYPGKVAVPARSDITGKPEFDLIDFIRIQIPGDMLNIVERPVRDSDKRDFPVQWQRYKNETEFRPSSGTPLEDWPRLDVAAVARMKAMGFHTVEQIADASDAMCQNIGMGCFELRTKAIAFVEAAKDSAYAQKQADQLAAQNLQIDELKTANRDLGAHVAKLTEQLAQLIGNEGAAVKRGPGRPPNASKAQE
jgi:hypothetical protein